MIALRAFAFLRSAVAIWLILFLGSVTGHTQLLEPKIRPLGATPTEIIKIFGPVLRHNARVRHHEILDGGDSIFTGDLHGKNGLIIRVVYHKDRCVLLEYTRVDGALSPVDVDTALAASVAGFAWEMGKDSTGASKFYHRTDGKAIAQWATGYDGSLLVTTEDSDNGFTNNLVH